MATCVADPDRLAREAATPPAQRPASLRDLDLDSLADFTGLTEKVRHNQIRADLEMTFRVLRLTGQEIRLFRDYAPTSLRRRAQGLTSPIDRLNGLVEFTQTWAGTDPERRLVLDILRYEHTLAVFTRDSTVDDDCRPTQLVPDSVLALHGRCIPVVTTCDPVAALEVLRAGEPDLDSIERRRHDLVYHRSPSGRIRVLEVEPGARTLIEAVDGQASVRQLTERLLGEDDYLSAVRDAYQMLTDLGVLTAERREPSCG